MQCAPVEGAFQGGDAAMIRSTDRILTTHAGSLPRPAGLRELGVERSEGREYDATELAQRLRAGVAEMVQKQIACGLDSINDGELSKTSFSQYARERLGGIEQREQKTGEGPAPQLIFGRDMPEFSEYLAARRSGPAIGGQRPLFCTGPLTYIGHEAIQADIDTFKAALQGVTVAETFLPAVAPGTIEHWLRNEHYASDEEYLYACAEAMRVEYKAIVDAGLLLQIDDPDLADAWQIYPEMSVPEYRKFAELRIDALNHALRGIPRESIRFHMCWGSYHGPHKYDIPLKDIVDLILKVPASSYSIEASKHEWTVWQDVKVPDGAVLIPGVVGHCTDFIEHPELIAQRLVKYANIVGKENVMGSTDCGLGTRVGHPNIAWAKFESLAEGARLASKELWG
jgi:5-methyltetrahydropteroyltriglutamate--homocysteine methyltransferase